MPARTLHREQEMASFPPKLRHVSAGKDPLDSFEALLSRHGTNLPGGAQAREEKVDPTAAAAKEIAAKIQAAVFEASVSDEPIGETMDDDPVVPEDIVAPQLFDEEFRTRVIALVRHGLVKEAETGTDMDRRQLACFEKAVAERTIVVMRAEQVEGLSYRATRSMIYGADGRIVDDGSSESWEDEFVYSQMAGAQSVIIGTAEAIGDVEASHYYVSFSNPDVLLTFDQQLYRLARQKAEEP
jgi:hypothetical protein